MNYNDQMPKYHELMNPLLQALHELGGSGSIEEIAQKVDELTDLPEDLLNVPHNPEKSSQTELEYRLAWARTYLKKYGLLENSKRVIWLIVPEKRDGKSVDPQEVVKIVRAEHKKQKQATDRQSSPEDDSDIEIPEETQSWRSMLHHVLINDMSPDAFERLAKRILRESGFVQVEVTGRTGDGAPPIDLVDGDHLADKLKELGLGIKKEMAEKISVDPEWFKAI